MKKSGNTARLVDLTASASKVCTVCHVHPDGDALGSSAAVYHYLSSLGKEVTILLPDAQPPSLNFTLAGTRYTSDPAEAALALQQADLLICLDFNTFSRTEALQEACQSFKGPKVLIDHHEDPEIHDFDLCFSRTDVSPKASSIGRTAKGPSAKTCFRRFKSPRTQAIRTSIPAGIRRIRENG